MLSVQIIHVGKTGQGYNMPIVVTPTQRLGKWNAMTFGYKIGIGDCGAAGTIWIKRDTSVELDVQSTVTS